MGASRHSIQMQLRTLLGRGDLISARLTGRLSLHRCWAEALLAAALGAARTRVRCAAVFQKARQRVGARNTELYLLNGHGATPVWTAAGVEKPCEAVTFYVTQNFSWEQREVFLVPCNEQSSQVSTVSVQGCPISTTHR